MEKFKRISVWGIFVLFLSILVIGAMPRNLKPALAEESAPEPVKYDRVFSYSDPNEDYEITLNFSAQNVAGDINISITPEHDKETLKKFHKYVKKDIDSADVGEVFYVSRTHTNEEDEEISGSYKFTIRLPKFYHKKEVAVIPFTDYRTTQKVKSVNVDEDGTITFTGSKSAYAYAIVYNGAYKDVIMIGVVMLVVLVACVLIKILCLRKDNPYYKEKKQEKAVAKKKQQHKQNKKLAQQLKREKERIKK